MSIIILLAQLSSGTDGVLILFKFCGVDILALLANQVF